MKQLLMALVIIYLASGAFAGYLYMQIHGSRQPDYSDMISRAEAEQMVEDALAGLDLKTEKPVKEEPVKEEPAVEPVVEEPAVVEVPEEKPAPKKKKKKFYRFKVGTERDNQNVRQSPNGKVLFDVPKGTEGYIVSKGDEWSLVWVNGKLEYMYTRYLDLEQIDKNDYPEALKGLSEADAGKKVSL